MSEKKVVVVIVEGPSDEASLGPVLKAWFCDDEVRFVVICGDITTDGNSSHDTIVRRINEHVEKIMRRYRYGKKDILRIIHICDTDGAFAKDTVRQADVPSIRYHSDHVDAPDALSVIARNERKSKLLYKLRTTGRVNGIEYRVYYNSCNLEHVLWNRRNVTSSHEKIRLSDEFAEKYEQDLEAFVELITDPSVAVPGTYKETWEYIEEGNNSLNRHSNLHLIFI